MVAGLVALRSLPYLVRGPKLILDDWWALRNARFSGTFGAAGHFQLLARPGAWLIFNLEFGSIGRHPLVLYLVQTVLNAVVGALLYLVARRFLDRWPAALVAGVWVLLPNHSAMDHWASTTQIVVALLLLLAGTWTAIRRADSGGSMWPAVACMVAGSLCYEAVLPAGALVLFAVPILCRGRMRWDGLIAGLVALGSTAAWQFAHAWRTVPGRFADLSLVWTAHFGAGVSPSFWIGRLLATAILAMVALGVGRLIMPSLRSAAGVPERLIAAGLVVIVAGTLPFVKFPISVIGINDRANVVSSVGAAMVWAGLIMLAARWRLAGVAAVVALVALMLPVRFQRDESYWRAGTDAERIVVVLQRQFPQPRGAVVLGPEAPNRHGVVGLVADWDTSAAWQLTSGDPSRAARITKTSGEFERAAEPQRIDLRPLLGG